MGCMESGSVEALKHHGHLIYFQEEILGGSKGHYDGVKHGAKQKITVAVH